MKENGEQYRHTLVQGSLITLVMTPPDEDIRFIVRVPQREGEYEAMYNQNLQRYFQRWQHIQQARVAERVAVAARANGQLGDAHHGPVSRRPPSKIILN
jgi:ABC-type branched-subunit amino acid transport system ATPase component